MTTSAIRRAADAKCFATPSRDAARGWDRNDTYLGIKGARTIRAGRRITISGALFSTPPVVSGGVDLGAGTITAFAGYFRAGDENRVITLPARSAITP